MAKNLPIVIEFLANDKEFQKAVKRAIKSSGAVEAAIEGANGELSKFAKTSKALKSFGSNFGNIGKSIAKVGGAVGAVGASLIALPALAIAAGAALGNALLGPSIEAAQVQEDAINSVATAMARMGEFSDSALKDMEQFASSLQEVTGVGDETTLQMVALAKGFGATNDEAKLMTEAAIELAAATGKSTDEAIQQVSKTLGGFAGELGEINPAIKALTREQLKAGEAAKVLLNQYGGTAAAALKTFSGALQASKNSFGDLLEEIGFLITRNKAVVTLLGGFKTAFELVGKAINQNKGLLTSFVTDGVQIFVKGLTVGVKALGFFIDLALEASIAVLQFIKEAQAITDAFSSWKNFGQLILRVLKLMSPLAGALGGPIALAIKAFEKPFEVGAETAETQKKIAAVQKRMEEVRGVTAGITNSISGVFASVGDAIASMSDEQVEATKHANQTKEELDKLGETAEKAANKAIEAFQSLSAEIRNVGLTEREVIKQTEKDRLAVVDAAIAAQKKLSTTSQLTPKQDKKFAAARIKIQQDAASKIADLEQKEFDKVSQRRDELNKRAVDGFKAVQNAVKDFGQTEIDTINKTTEQRLAAIETAKNAASELGPVSLQQQAEFAAAAIAVEAQAAEQIKAIRLAKDEEANKEIADQRAALFDRVADLASAAAQVVTVTIDAIVNAATSVGEAAEGEKTAGKELEEAAVNFKAVTRKAREAAENEVRVRERLADQDRELNTNIIRARDDLAAASSEGSRAFAQAALDQAIAARDNAQRAGLEQVTAAREAAKEFNKELQSAKDEEGDAGKKLDEAAENFANSVQEAGTGLLNGLAQGVGGIFGDILSSITSVVANPEVFIEGIKLLVAALPDITRAFVAALPDIVDAFVEALPEISAAISEALEVVGVIIADALPVILRALLAALPRLIKAISTIVVALIKQLPDILIAILEELPDIITAIFDALPDIVLAIVDALPEIAEALADNVGPIVTALVEGLAEAGPAIAIGLIDSLVLRGGAIRIAWAFIQGINSGMVALVQGLLAGLASSASAFATFFGSTFLSGLNAVKDKIISVFQMPTPTWLEDIQNFFTGTPEWLKKLQETFDSFNPTKGDTSEKAKKVLDPGGLVEKGLGAVGINVATGGIVKGSGNRDTVPARLSPGELVIDRTTGPRLNEFIDQFSQGQLQQGKGGGNTDILLAQILSKLSEPTSITTQAEVNGEVFADIMLDISRQNGRTE